MKAEFDKATEGLNQTWVGAQPNDWGFVQGSSDVKESAAELLTTSIFMTIGAVIALF